MRVGKIEKETNAVAKIFIYLFLGCNKQLIFACFCCCQRNSTSHTMPGGGGKKQIVNFPKKKIHFYFLFKVCFPFWGMCVISSQHSFHQPYPIDILQFIWLHIIKWLLKLPVVQVNCFFCCCFCFWPQSFFLYGSAKQNVAWKKKRDVTFTYRLVLMDLNIYFQFYLLVYLEGRGSYLK